VLIKSYIEGSVWPAIAEGQTATLAALMLQLERSQFYPPEVLFAHQREQLKAVFAHAKENVPFYTERFAKAGFDPRGDITPETIRRLPVLTRLEFQQGGDGTVAKRFPAKHGKAFQIRTSGTTGRPVVLSKTPFSQLIWSATEIRGHLWHRRDVRGKLAVIRWVEKPKAMAPAGSKVNSWGHPAALFFPATGPVAVLNIASKLEDQAEWLIRENPDYLLSYASNILALAEFFERNGYTLPRLREISTVSEVVTDGLRQTCRRVWNVPVVDSYSCEEAGYLALQCSHHTHYHVQAENVYLEVVDDKGDPCAAGEVGRVVITTLHNFSSPLIRYEVGDYAEVGNPCPCGRGLPVITRILGRQRNRLVLPNGDTEFPYLGEHKEYQAITDAVRQFQFIQRSVDEIEQKLVVSKPLTREQEEAMKALIVRSLGHPFRVTLTYHDDIPRGASGKFEEFICEVRR